MKWQSEMRAETDRFARERKDLSEQIQDLESQLEWLRSERDDEVGKLTAKNKVLQDRLHDADTQLSLLKSRKRDELKVVYFICNGYASFPLIVSENGQCLLLVSTKLRRHFIF